MFPCRRVASQLGADLPLPDRYFQSRFQKHLAHLRKKVFIYRVNGYDSDGWTLFQEKVMVIFWVILRILESHFSQGCLHPVVRLKRLLVDITLNFNIPVACSTSLGPFVRQLGYFME